MDEWAVTFCTPRRGPDELHGAPPSHLLAVPNVTAHPSTVSVPITVLLYDGLLFCRFNVAIKGLMSITCNYLHFIIIYVNNEIALKHSLLKYCVYT